MKNESIMKGAKTDTTRIQIRSVTVGSAAFVILLSIFQQASAQIAPNNSYANMLNIINSQNQIFWNQQNSYNQWLANQGTRALADRVPVMQQQSFAAVFSGHTWQVRSAGLACQGLVAVFQIGGTFQGILKNPPNNVVIRPQRVGGRWYVASPLLLLAYNYIDNLSGTARAEFTIQITGVSQRSLTGVDTRLRLWDFERLD
jgi:hypothetical protein